MKNFSTSISTCVLSLSLPTIVQQFIAVNGFNNAAFAPVFARIRPHSSTTPSTTTTCNAFALDVNTSSSRMDCFNSNFSQERKSITALFGILDDMDAGSSSSSNDDDSEYDTLLTDVVFTSGNPKTILQRKIQVYSSDSFLQWLDTKSNTAEDDEERTALQDLLNLIAVVQKEVEETEQEQNQEKEAMMQQRAKEVEEQTRLEEEQQQSLEGTKSESELSDADLLKKVSDIDGAVMMGSSDDSDKPSDFMTDAKAECGLGGFNNRGQMRVGG